MVAGAIEAGELAREAAIRELHEETGLQAMLDECVQVVEYVSPATMRPPLRASELDSAVAVATTCYHVSAPDKWEPELDAEHDAHRWCSPMEAADALIWRETARALPTLVPGR